MPPTDAHVCTGPVTDAGADARPRPDTSRTGVGGRLNCPDGEDTLDLRLPYELLAGVREGVPGPGPARPGTGGTAPLPYTLPKADDLLDGIGAWGPIATPVGVFQLVPVQIARDLALIGRWMNDPAVAEFWALAGPHAAVEEHLRRQLLGDGRSIPCLGVLAGTPMSYWEIYRADLDPLARHYAARPHDTGIHLLVGDVSARGRGLGSVLLHAIADLVLDRRPTCARVVAEPALRNIPSVAAFLSAGFRFSAEVDLPAKRAALMVRDRFPRRLV
ncbi:GNAT family N-acetyltransferase [Streptomyces sp. NPDC005263]|uniref:GNAT family N-acetyltransferase n=1 Tax=Streptomyces sp. NPDC005263 TaxID=3364711 RepID=UPI0036C42820